MDVTEKKVTSNAPDDNKIKVAVADIDGILRGKYLHSNKLQEIKDKGFGFCDVVFGWDSMDKCYDFQGVTGWHTGYPDGTAKIDPSTYRRIPWENNIPFYIADFSTDEKYNQVSCPRSILKKIGLQASEMGFKPMFSQEFEWFNYDITPDEFYKSEFHNIKPMSPGMFGYSILRTALNNAYFTDLFDQLNAFDIPIEGLHTETGPGVLEATIIYDEIISAADKAVLFKTAVKEIAARHHKMATFMAKVSPALPGCGGHLHQSLWDIDGKKNLFHSEKGLSETMKHYLAGVLHCLPEIMPLYAPTVNSYKRIGHGDWAPASVSWGIDNRTASARAIVRGEKATRIELRVPGADMNPYLTMAASLASGLYGIKNRLSPGPETTGNAYRQKLPVLPHTLEQAVAKMEKSKIARELFGEPFVKHFLSTRKWELNQFNNTVTDWELKRYFEII